MSKLLQGRVALCVLAALACGLFGGLNAYLHPLRASGKMPNPPTVTEQAFVWGIALGAMGLIATVAVLAVMAFFRRHASAISSRNART
jgi:hypothetical protein